MEIYRTLLELNRKELDFIDKSKTLVVIPVGIIEQHGPHLPVGTDCFMAEAAAIEMINQIHRQKPGWKFVLFPTIFYGTQSIDEVSKNFSSVGSIPIRSSVLRDLVIDLGNFIAKSGFQYVTLLNRHGSPLHTRALDEASQFVREKFDIKMFSIRFRTNRKLIERANSLMTIPLTRENIDNIITEVHAGCIETSCIMSLYPSLVNGIYKSLTPVPLMDAKEIYTKANEKGWEGFFGFPHLAKAEFGKAIIMAVAIELAEKVIEVLKGSEYPEYKSFDNPEQLKVNKQRLDEEMNLKKEIRQWFQFKKSMSSRGK